MFRHYRGVFRDSTARALFTSAAISGLGDWVGLAGLVILAFQRSGSSIGSGSLFLVQGVAAVISTTLLGPQLDRFDRSRALTLSYLTGASSLLVPVVLDGLWPVIFAAAMVGLLRPTSSALRHAIAGNELDEELLGPVVALQKATGDMTAAIGLATGGLLTVLLGPALSLGLDSLTFLTAAALAITLPRGRGELDVRRSPFRGYAVWLRDPDMRTIMLALAAIAAVGALPETLAPEIVGDSAWFAAVVASQAVGTAIGGVLIGHRSHLERVGVLTVGVASSALLLVAGAAVVQSPPWMLTVANFLLGIAFSVAVLGQTAMTRRAPKDRIGAVIASAITTVMLAEGIGSVLVGGVSEQFGPGAAYAVPGLFVLIIAALLAVLGRKDTLEDAPDTSIEQWAPPSGPPAGKLTVSLPEDSSID